MQILEFSKDDLAILRGFGAGVERDIDAYSRNATELDPYV